MRAAGLLKRIRTLDYSFSIIPFHPMHTQFFNCHMVTAFVGHITAFAVNVCLHRHVGIVTVEEVVEELCGR